jgi:hypothetical protein
MHPGHKKFIDTAHYTKKMKNNKENIIAEMLYFSC